MMTNAIFILCRSTICSETMFNSTPTNTAHDRSSLFHIPPPVKVRGLYSALLSFSKCLEKVWNVQFQVTRPVQVAGNLTVDSQSKYACVTKHHIPGVGALRSVCILEIPPSALFQIAIQASVMKLKSYDKVYPPTKRRHQFLSPTELNSWDTKKTKT